MRTEIELSLQQFVEAWRMLGAPGPQVLVEHSGGVTYTFCGVPIAFFNSAFLTQPGASAAELAGQAQAARTWAADKGVPWVLITTEEMLGPGVDSAATLGAEGFVPIMTLAGMIADDVADEGALPAGLELRNPADDASCAALFDVNAAAYGMPFDAAKPVWAADFWGKHVAVLGESDGQPVSSSAVMLVDGYRYVALVATHPDWQRRGYGNATMRESLRQARERYGALPTFLHATEAGRPVYERMGYRAVAKHLVFMDGALLGGH